MLSRKDQTSGMEWEGKVEVGENKNKKKGFGWTEK